EDGDLSLEAIEDEEVALVDGFLKVHLVHLEMSGDGLELEALVNAMEVMVVDDQ
nr:hypothetical protein [Tanacetum cinerariifolium]